MWLHCGPKFTTGVSLKRVRNHFVRSASCGLSLLPPRRLRAETAGIHVIVHPETSHYDPFPFCFAVTPLGMSFATHSYLTPCGPRPPFEDGERIPWLAVTVESSPIALVPASSTYAHPAETYDHTLGCNPMGVRSTHLPSYVEEFIRYEDEYLDARTFAAVPIYIREKKKARETSLCNSWLHLPADV